MQEVKLAYRDNDRTPVIFCIKEMASRYYGIDLKVKQGRNTACCAEHETLARPSSENLAWRQGAQHAAIRSVLSCMMSQHETKHSSTV